LQPLCRVGQHRRQDRLQVVHHAQDHIHRRRRGLGILLDLKPWCLAVQACTACPEQSRGERSECVAVGLAQACPEGTEGAARNLQALYSPPTVSKPASTCASSARSSSSRSPGSGTTPSKRLRRNSACGWPGCPTWRPARCCSARRNPPRRTRCPGSRGRSPSGRSAAGRGRTCSGSRVPPQKRHGSCSALRL
jgi:hypothetical protein